MSNYARFAWRHSRIEIGGAVVSFIVALAISAQFAYYYIFSKFQSYDDEGFMLISLKSFFDGHALYDKVYSPYQPFCYLFDRLVYSLWGVPLCHDSMRLLTIVLWLTAAAINAYIVYRLTASSLLALFIFVLSVNYLQAFSFEPGHPQTLVYLLAVGIVALLASMENISRSVFTFVAGVLVGFLLLTKVNVGVSAMLAVALVITAGTPGVIAARLQQAIGAAMVALPVALIYPRIHGSFWSVPHIFLLGSLVLVMVVPLLLQGRARMLGFICTVVCAAVSLTAIQSVNFYGFQFGLLLAFSAYCVVLIACASRQDAELRYKEWLWGLAGGGMAIVVVLGTVVLYGTSLQGLIEGLFLAPSKLFTFISAGGLGAPTSTIVSLSALAGVVACYAYLWARVPMADRRWFHYILAVAKIIFAILVIVNRNPSMPPKLVSLARWLPDAIPTWPPIFLAFSWLAVVPGRNRPAKQIARFGLAAMAVVMPLVAYAGDGTTHVAYGGVLTFVVAAVCFSDGIETFKTFIPNSIRFSWLRPVIGVMVVFAILLPFNKQASWMHKHYSSLTPLELPGASRIRLNAEDAHLYQDLVRLLARPEVETFLTLPGKNSLYFWAQKDPPTGFNITVWTDLLTESCQRQIWEAFNKHSGVMVLRDGVAWAMTKGRPVEKIPFLERHINDNFKTITTVGRYEVMVRQ